MKISLLLFSLFLLSCQDTIPRRTTITPVSSAEEGALSCPEGEEEVTSELSDGSLEKTCQAIPPSRPRDAVFWDSEKPQCACKDQESVSFGTDCENFCSSKQTGGAVTFYGHFTVTEDISLGSLGSLYGWCVTALETDVENPKCMLKAENDSGDISYFDINISDDNSNSLTVDINNLEDDEVYLISLVETTSNLSTDAIQLMKSSELTPPVLLGPLKIAPITQYACVVRNLSSSTTTGSLYYDSAYKLHYYFVPRNPPLPVGPSINQYFCHDIFNPNYSLFDQTIYPRLDESPAHINLWDVTDPRFFDLNSNSYLDVNEQIIQRAQIYGTSLAEDTNFFFQISYLNYPSTESNAETQPEKVLGYAMTPFIDPTTYKSFCYHSEHYNSNNPLARAIHDIVGVETEGLYMGEKSKETWQLSSGEVITGFTDRIFLKESDIKSVWFYMKDGVHLTPTDSNVGDYPIYFYYPLNKENPFIQNAQQKLYQVMSASSEINPNNTPTTLTNYPSHDRKIGCIPKL